MAPAASPTTAAHSRIVVRARFPIETCDTIRSMPAKNVARRASANSTRYLVPVVRSTFRILEVLSNSGSMSLNEITVRTRVPKSTVFRILSTLHYLGYVLREESKRTYASAPASPT